MRKTFRTPRVGLRARITIAFGLGAAILSVLLSLTALTVARNTLLNSRERLVVDRAARNAELIENQLESQPIDDQTATVLFNSLSSLATVGSPVVLLDAGTTTEPLGVSFDPELGAELLPESLVDAVSDGRPSVMRFDISDAPYLVVGLPLLEDSGGYFEISPLEEVEDNIRGLAYALAGAAAVTIAAGAALGWWASRRLLGPLRAISSAAVAVTEGEMETRLPDPRDRDLSPLVSSFNEMVQALQNRIDQDARFASDVSHELRSPLMTLQASVHVLENAREELPERAQTALDLLSSDVERFAQLVEDLLEISRFDVGAVRLEIDEVGIVDTVSATVQHASRGVPVRFDPALIGLVIRVDKRRLNRILANFLDNAEKYGGGATMVSIEREGEVLRVAVEDEGPGVSEEERLRIFDRFSRGDQAGSRGADRGVGLGLALADEHARLQGGRVWVEERPDGKEGARFVFELPLPDEEETADEAPKELV